MAVNQEYADGRRAAARGRRAGADPAGVRAARCASRTPASRPSRWRWIRWWSGSATRAPARWSRSSASPARSPRSSTRPTREMAERKIAEIVARGDRAPRPVRGRGRAPGRRRAAVGAVGGRSRCRRRTATRRSPARARSSTRSRRRLRSGRRRRANGCGDGADARAEARCPRCTSSPPRSTRRTRSRWRRRGGRSTSGARAMLAGAAAPATTCWRGRASCSPRSSSPSLRRVINATGVIVHTNLGRAPLPAAARDAVARAADGYSQPRARPRSRRARHPPRTTSRGCCAS